MSHPTNELIAEMKQEAEQEKEFDLKLPYVVGMFPIMKHQYPEVIEFLKELDEELSAQGFIPTLKFAIQHLEENK